jgi:hypothetical protein
VDTICSHPPHPRICPLQPSEFAELNGWLPPILRQTLKEQSIKVTVLIILFQFVEWGQGIWKQSIEEQEPEPEKGGFRFSIQVFAGCRSRDLGNGLGKETERRGCAFLLFLSCHFLPFANCASSLPPSSHSFPGQWERQSRGRGCCLAVPFLGSKMQCQPQTFITGVFDENGPPPLLSSIKDNAQAPSRQDPYVD